jgi:hypothetical protein
MSQTRRVAASALGCVALTLAGCGAGADEPFDIDSTEPLAALPPCEAPPSPSDDPPVDGLVVPDGSVVTSVTPQGPVTSVLGYIPMTPIQIRFHYTDREGLELMVLEDEVYEAEVLLGSGAHRMYLKANASCDEGSSFQAIVAPEVDAEGLPVPDGVPDQPAP